jgi:alpha-L-fucosidase
LKVGIYYSLLDWYHDDYPSYGDKHHSIRDNVENKDETRDFSRYIECMHDQIRELLTNYGKIDVVWFDFSYDDMSGETWGSTELVEMCYELQPDIIIGNRLGGNIKAS